MDSRKKHDRLKALLKRATLEKPPLDFTSVVMDEINAGPQSSADFVLASLLKDVVPENPSGAFTSRVIAQVDKRSSQRAHQPVISYKFWLAAGITFIISLIWIGASMPMTSPQGLTPELLKLGALINRILAEANGGMVMYVATALAGGALMLLEYYLVRTRKSEL